MARAQAEKVGRGACPACGSPVWYRRSISGLLSHKCEECESSGYAERNGPAYVKNMATIKAPTAPAPTPDATPPEPNQPSPPAAKPAKKSNFAFYL